MAALRVWRAERTFQRERRAFPQRIADGNDQRLETCQAKSTVFSGTNEDSRHNHCANWFRSGWRARRNHASEGRAATASNIHLRCRAHNAYDAEEWFVLLVILEMTPRPAI